MNQDNDQVEQHIQRHSALERRVLLLSPTMGWWRGQYQLKAAKNAVEQATGKGYTITIGDKDVDTAKITKPQVKLLEAGSRAKNWLKRFQTLDSERNALIERYSVPFPGIRGVRIVPRDAAASFFGDLIGLVDAVGRPLYESGRSVQSIGYRLAQLADQFVSGFHELTADMQQNIDAELWDQVAHKIPTRERIREKFYMDVSAIELSGSSPSQVRREDIDQYENLIRESTLRKADEAIEEMISGPREELAKALTELEALIQRNGKVTERSFNGVRQAIEKIRLFDFVANESLLQQITEIENRLEIAVPKALDSTTATSNGLFAAINNVRDEVNDEVKRCDDYAKFGRHLRGFDLS